MGDWVSIVRVIAPNLFDKVVPSLICFIKNIRRNFKNIWLTFYKGWQNIYHDIMYLSMEMCRICRIYSLTFFRIYIAFVSRLCISLSFSPLDGQRIIFSEAYAFSFEKCYIH
jgi:hypothetical protein